MASERGTDITNIENGPISPSRNSEAGQKHSSVPANAAIALIDNPGIGIGAKAPRQLQSIQVMRGLAALAVVFYHTHLILMQPEYGGIAVFAEYANHGLLGVNFFFVLSGFIILFAHRRDLRQPSTIPRYAYRRFSRIYPTYWVLTTLYIAAAAVGLGYPDFAWDFGNLLSAYSLFELHWPISLPLQVAWTLFYEIKFYLAFAVLILSPRAGIVLFLIWTLAIIVAFPLGLHDPWNFLSPWNIYFPAGMLVFLAWRRLDGRFGMAILALGTVMLALYAANFNLSMGQIKSEFELVLFWLAPSMALFVLGVIVLESRYQFTAPVILKFLGDASFSIYLVHSSAISVIVIVMRRFGLLDLLPATILFFGVFVAASICGVLAHVVIERPLLAMARRADVAPRHVGATQE